MCTSKNLSKHLCNVAQRLSIILFVASTVTFPAQKLKQLLFQTNERRATPLITVLKDDPFMHNCTEPCRTKKREEDVHATVQRLISAKVDVDARDLEGNTALLVATRKRCMVAMQLLLDAGACPNKADQMGRTPLWEAIRRHNTFPCVEPHVLLLIGRGSDVNQLTNTQTPLMEAARRGLGEVVEKLLKAGARVDVADSNGCTALHFASIGFASEVEIHEKVIALLLAAGANIHARNKKGMTAGEWAAAAAKESCRYVVDNCVYACLQHNAQMLKEEYDRQSKSLDNLS